MKRSTLVVGSAAVLLVFFVVAGFAFKANEKAELSQNAQANVDALNRQGSPSLGSEAAKVHLVEFFDPACEACRAFYPYVKQLVNFSGDKVRLSLRYATFHHGSDYVAKALEAARLQGKYWEAVEAVLAAQPEWADHGAPQPERIWPALQNAGIDVSRAQQEMRSPEIAARLAQDTADVAALKIERTPSFFVNGKPLTEFGPDKLSALVRAEVQQHYSQ
ncbi:DsbA family protein [Chitinolyticbacter meiyuanensis]|uniref:DsbA family protein n=1 Tax=Chitinolyticbacter meiyuanensis TaxID=682798 RepID=UPI0011E58CFE|nr:thioredoxin domain-containing protein [Chitinolyticbacter meiyuanensis]